MHNPSKYKQTSYPKLRLLFVIVILCLVALTYRMISNISRPLLLSKSDNTDYDDNDDNNELNNNIRHHHAPLFVSSSEKSKKQEQEQKQQQNEKQQQISSSFSFQQNKELVSKFLLFSELRRVAAFRLLSSSSSSSSIKKACFIALVRHSHEGVKKFYRLVKNVRENLPLMAKRYPFVAFLEEGANIHDVISMLKNEFIEKDSENNKNNQQNEKDEMLKSGSSFVLFQNFYKAGIILQKVPQEDFGQIPSWVPDERSHPWPYPSHSWWKIPYRFMCRFFGVRVMNQQIFFQQKKQNENEENFPTFDYYMRLDTDSFILERPKTTSFIPIITTTENNNEKQQQKSVLKELFDEKFLQDSSRWIQIANGIENNNNNQNENENGNDNNNNNNEEDAKLLSSVFGFKEVEVDVDYFLDMAASDSKYSFSMIHPQTIPQFLNGLWEMYDEFYRKEKKRIFEEEENKKQQEKEDFVSGTKTTMRFSSKQLPRDDTSEFLFSSSSFQKKKNKNVVKNNRNTNINNGPTPFASSRSAGLHFWDNIEIVNTKMFREISSCPSLFDEDDEGKTISQRRRKGKTTNSFQEIPNFTEIRNQIIEKSIKNKNNNNKNNNNNYEGRKIVVFLKQETKAKLLLFKKHNERAKALQRFLSHVDHSSGFFLYRHGDAEIRTLTVSLFLQSSEIVYHHTLPYQHYHNYHCPGGKEHAMVAFPSYFLKQQQEQQQQQKQKSSWMNKKSLKQKEDSIPSVLTSSSMPFAIERGEAILQQKQNQKQQNKNEKNEKEEEDEKNNSPSRETIEQVIFDVASYLREQFDIVGNENEEENSSFLLLQKILSPATSGHLSQKTRNAVADYLSSKRYFLLRKMRKSCEVIARKEGNSLSSLFEGKGKGGAAMFPCEHDMNNQAFWNFVRQQKDGFSAI